MLRSILTLSLTAFAGLTLLAQMTITGRVIDERTSRPLQGVLVSTDLTSRAATDENGRFTVSHVERTTVQLTLDYGTVHTIFATEIAAALTTDIGDVIFNPSPVKLTDQELPTIAIDDDENAEAASISGLLQTGGDLFSKITGYTFGPARFNRRGLEGEYAKGYLNYFPVNDLESGGLFYSSWGGLNDVMRLDDEVVGAEISEWGFGGISATINTDLRASSQRERKRLSYSVTNRNYRNRLMATWSTGPRPGGWAVTLSGSKRWAQEGYIPGTYYDAYSYFASVDKELSQHHSLGFVVLGAPYERGGNSAAILEMYELANDHYYNSYWGFQQGEKRSGRVYNNHQPIFMLRHDWKLNDQASLTTSLGYQTGKNGLKTLDWLNANDPRPDYYRRLPSYVDDPALAEQIRVNLTENPELLQIQWDELYQVNYHSNVTINNVNGIEGQTHTGRLSQYVVENRLSDTDKKTANVVLQYLLGQHAKLQIGGTAVLQNTRNYKELADLLGGEFYIDWDKYAEQDFPGNENALQNDLNRPNRLVMEGDQFGWDYESHISQYTGWFSYAIDAPKWELGLAGAVENHSYFRKGNTQNGKFPDNSFGDGEKHDFFLPSAKALLRYKLDGRNYLTVSGLYADRAPNFRNAYVSPRTRDAVVSGLEAETVTMGEARYDLKSPYLKLTVAGFYIKSENAIESSNFYHDDERTFVNFSLTGIDKQYKGMEAAVEYTLFPGFTLQGAAAVGEYIYTSRPTATITQDNDGNVLQENITIFAQNLYVSGTPQEAYTLGMSYRSKKYWTLYLNVNRFAENWVNFNPLRRTYESIDLVEYGSDQWNSILRQEKIDAGWTVDISFYKSFLIDWPKERALLAFNIGITNLLDNTDYINNGFEQYRFDFTAKDVNSFPTRYNYMQGRNFFLQGSLTF